MVVVLLPRRQGAALPLGAAGGLLVVQLQLAAAPVLLVAEDLLAEAGQLLADGVVRRDVRALVGRAEVGPSGLVEVPCGLLLVRDAQEPRDGARFRRADRLAVPARALGVDLRIAILVRHRGPLECLGQLVLVDLVVVVDELVGLLGREVVIRAGA